MKTTEILDFTNCLTNKKKKKGKKERKKSFSFIEMSLLETWLANSDILEVTSGVSASIYSNSVLTSYLTARVTNTGTSINFTNSRCRCHFG